jgi:RHS repeat-associated protein
MHSVGAWLSRVIIQAVALVAVTAVPALAQMQANIYDYARTSAFTYDPVTGLLATETVEPANTALCVLTTYGYDVYGNKNSSTTSNCANASGAALFTSRSSSSDFGTTIAPPAVTIAGVSVSVPVGAFPLVAKNALSQAETRAFDPRFGAALSLTGPNSLTTNWQLDDFGRAIVETRADNTRTVTMYCYVPGAVTAGWIGDLNSNSPGCAGLNVAASEIPADALSFIHTEPHNTSDIKNGAFTRVYVDRAGHKIRTVTEAFDGAQQVGGSRRLVAQDIDYNAQGAAIIATQPYFLDSSSSTSGGSSDYGMSLTQYDVLGRPLQVYTADPQGKGGNIQFGGRGTRKVASTTLVYSGLVTTTTYDLGATGAGTGATRKEEKNIDGKLGLVTNDLGASIAYDYDAFGNLVQTKDALQNIVKVGYDIRGRKVSINDPDSGITLFGFDALGQLISQQNAGQTASTATTMTYDLLGRMTQRVDPEYTSNWSYDKYAGESAPGTCSKGVGKLCQVTTTNGLSRKFTYDALGRASNVSTAISGGPTMATSISYDSSSGRVASRTWPTGLNVNYGYTAKGFLSQLTLGTAVTINPLPATVGGTPGASKVLAANSLLWQAQSLNAWARVEKQSFGNGVTDTETMDAATGRLLSSKAGTGTTSNVMDYSYSWDSMARLTSRTDGLGDGATGAVTDGLSYDSIGRLQSYTVSAAAIPNLGRSVGLTYNALGMMLYKSDVGVYSYPAQGGSHPHALQGVAGAFASAYSYDTKGNVTSATNGSYRSLAYTSFNMPDNSTGIQGPAGSPQYLWQYDENHQRIMEQRTNGSGTRKTWMMHPDNTGGLYFEVEQSGSTYNNRHYISAGGASFAVLVQQTAAYPNQGTPPTIASMTLVKQEYWHKDHLGSLVATTDHNGAVTARYSYDPFGKRRVANGNYDANGQLVYDWNNTNSGTDRGYTGHEHLDDVGVIHMNGRTYDPLLGRFMQPDPFVQNPDNLQSYERYTYCNNTPLTCTDPSGYLKIFGIHVLPGLLNNNTLRLVASIAVAAVLGPEAYGAEWGWLAGTIENPVIQVAVAGFASGAIASGNVKGGLQGAFTAEMFYGVGQAITGYTDSTGSVTDYGKFIDAIAAHGVVGCVSSVAAGSACGPGALSAAFSKAVLPVTGPMANGDAAGGALVSAVVGGTASVLGGGRFANGAKTAAFGYLFNYCSSGKCTTNLEQKLYDYWPGYKAGTLLYNQTMGDGSWTGWEVVDGLSVGAGVMGKTVQFLGRAFTTAPDLISELNGAIEINSGLKADLGHLSAIFFRSEALETGSYFEVVGGDKVSRILVQMPSDGGRFEYLYQKTKIGWELTHQMFVKGGTINGIPIVP